MWHIWDVRATDKMLSRILSVIEPPVETRVVLAVAIPALGNVDLTFMRPYKRLAGQEPECRPNPLRTRKTEPSRQTTIAAA